MKKVVSTVCLDTVPHRTGIEGLKSLALCKVGALSVFLNLTDDHFKIITDIVSQYNITDIVDVGCGSGWHALQIHNHLKQHGRDVNVVAIDSDNKDHFAPDVKLPFVNIMDATELTDLPSITLLLSI